MDPLASYILPIGGLDIGKHQYSFKLDDHFLQHCENSPYSEADVNFELEVDRRANMIVLDASMQGHVRCICDRCISAINLPIQSTHRVILRVKEGMETASEDDIIYIEPGLKTFSVAPLLYDLFILAIPIKKIYDCEKENPLPCDLEIINRLEKGPDEQDTNTEGPSIWDDLKKEFN